jgi:hypothetical protein
MKIGPLSPCFLEGLWKLLGARCVAFHKKATFRDRLPRARSAEGSSVRGQLVVA